MRRTLLTLAVTLSILLASWRPAVASCGSSSCPLDLHALAGADNSRFVLDLSFQYIHQNMLQHGTARGTVGEIATKHDEISTTNRLTTLQASYRVSPRLQLSALLPFVSRSHEHIARDNGQLEQWNFGAPGDAAVQARYRLFQSERSTHDSLWITGGVKFPTGARHERSGNSGEEAEVTLQPGSGSTDVSVGAAYQGAVLRNTTVGGPMGNVTAIPYFASVTYRRNGAGTYGYRRGDELLASIGSEYPLSSKLNALGQVNVRRSSRDGVGSTEENPALTGGTYVYVSPGIRLLLRRGVSGYAYVQLPVYQNVNGLQLTARANYLAGIQQRF
jgi:hypothetical protein